MTEPTTVHAVRLDLAELGMAQDTFTDSQIAALIAEPTPNGKPRSTRHIVEALKQDAAFNSSAAPEAIRLYRADAQRLGVAPAYVAQLEGHIVATTDGGCAYVSPFKPHADGRIAKPVVGTPAEVANWALRDAMRTQELERRRKVAIAGAAEARKDETNPTRFRYGNGF
jgi:hypothetical protein